MYVSIRQVDHDPRGFEPAAAPELRRLRMHVLLIVLDNNDGCSRAQHPQHNLANIGVFNDSSQPVLALLIIAQIAE